MLFTDCAALLCLTGTTGRLLDPPSLVPVQVQKRNDVLKFTSLKNIEYSAWSIFFRKLMSHWSEVLQHLLVEVHAFIAFQNSTTVFICGIEVNCILSHTVPWQMLSIHCLQPFALFKNSCNRVLGFLVLFISKCPIDRDRVAWACLDSRHLGKANKLVGITIHVHIGGVVNLVMMFTCASNFLPEINYITKLTAGNFEFSLLRVP